MSQKPQLGLQRPSTTSTGSQKISVDPLTTLTVQIPSSLHRAMKRRAIDDGLKLRELLIKLCADAGIK